MLSPPSFLSTTDNNLPINRHWFLTFLTVEGDQEKGRGCSRSVRSAPQCCPQWPPWQSHPRWSAPWPPQCPAQSSPPRDCQEYRDQARVRDGHQETQLAGRPQAEGEAQRATEILQRAATGNVQQKALWLRLAILQTSGRRDPGATRLSCCHQQAHGPRHSQEQDGQQGVQDCGRV